MSPVSSPHAVPPHGPAGNVASPPYPCSPTAASTPPGMSAIPWTCLYFCPAMLILWYSMPLLLRTQAASGSWRSCPAWLQRHVSLPKCPCLCELASVRPFLCSDAQDTSAEARWARHHPCSLAPQAPLAVQLLPLHLARRPWELPEPTCTPIAVEHCRLSCLRSAAACCLWSPCATCKASKPAGVRLWECVLFIDATPKSIPTKCVLAAGAIGTQLSGSCLQASSGMIQGASPNHASAISPAGSGHLPYHPPSYSHHAQADHTVSCHKLS